MTGQGSVPGIPQHEIMRLLTPVTPGEGAVDPAAIADRFARAALSTAIEPGDLDAGRLLDLLGPTCLLGAIVDGWEVRRIREAAASSASGPGGSAAGVLGGPVTDLASEHPPSAEVQAEGVPSERRLTECLARWRPRLSLAEASRALERAATLGARLLTPESEAWPDGLASLENGSPIALWVRGDADGLLRLERSIALVGARASTEYGEHVAMESAAGLADRGFAVVSGGAYGIDAAAHRAALVSGGLTVAFLAGGVDRLYPAGNNELLRRIAAEGVLAAELPPGNAPTRWRFLMRNRLIAAAASATVVVEAGRRSGSLNTAGHASQLGRPLGAVPGSVLSPASAGCHRLIREYDAVCVTTTEEMAELADPYGTGPRVRGADSTEPVTSAVTVSHGDEKAATGPGPDVERRILSAMSASGGSSADEIAVRAALPFTTVAAILGRLDLAGRARERAGGWTRTESTRR
ncbi:DNA-processing protein DprA [Leifsonia sp. fls2-241-R2A-40a]|uniref:DNA-processing protein DprA n=1 Tax=Leifsonia sp. fls2-241-R2A-40a TaxID=3040290 RepID=UPI00254E0DE2|nr:DNA-processing protein DprA [Leifsonia sp. fls2-241-R2A-40a]